MTMSLSAELSIPDTSLERRRLQARARRLAKRALTLAGEGRMDEAIACQTEVAALRPHDSGAFHRLGLLYRDVRRIDPAVQAFRQATHLSPAQRDPREALTEMLVEAGRYQEAVTEGRELLKLAPRSLFARDALSVAYLQLGQLHRALQTTAEMVWLDPLNPGHHFRRGLLFQQLGNIKAAVGEYARSLEMAHPESEVYSDSADALEMLDDGQLRQILLLASEDRLFLLKLRRDCMEASQERGFFLSEDGQGRLEFLLPREFPDFPCGFPAVIVLGQHRIVQLTLMVNEFRAALGRRTLIMGVVNVTPDSFSDGGLYADPKMAITHALRLAAEGADILDIGGESTRPATFRDQSPLSIEEEKRRILPVIAQIAIDLPHLPISVDTYKAEVAEAALEAGASIINDISGLTYDPKMASLAAERGVPLILMHMPGRPRSLPLLSIYEDVVADVIAFLQRRIAYAKSQGVGEDNIWLDPGLGFGKTTTHNLEILRRLAEIKVLGYPLVVGASRKRFIGKVLETDDPNDRKEGTAATVALSIAAGADIVRVHDVREMARVAKVSDAIVRGWAE